MDAKQLSQILIETGINLAEVAPTPNAETIGLQSDPDGATAPQSPVNGTGAGNTFPGGIGGMQN